MPERRAEAGSPGGGQARVRVDVAGRTLTLSNLDRELYPARGGVPAFRKADLIDYYVRVAAALLPHLRGRPVSLKRCPDGVDEDCFFAKNAPSHTPEWITTVSLDSPGSTRGPREVTYLLLDDEAALVWVANLAAIELHVPQWRAAADGVPERADRLVLDLDPGPGRDIVDCCDVALRLRDALGADGLTAYVKTSGSKGLHLYAGLEPTDADRVAAYVHALARRMEAAHPDLMVATMAKRARADRVFLDWSQNRAAKTTVAPYSLRSRPAPTVSTPLTWDEVAACRSHEDLAFTPADVLARIATRGDLLAPLLDDHAAVPS